MNKPRHLLAMGLTFLVTAGLGLDLAAQERKGDPAAMTVYVGTYTGPKSKGIYMMKMDAATGTLSTPELAGEMASPSFLTLHPSNKYLYAIGEVDTFNGKKGGAVAAFSIDPATGKLTLINQKTSGGRGPCFVNLDATGKVALVANYGGGSIESLPVNDDGSLGEPAAFVQHTGSSVDKSRQSEPHAHSLNPTPDNKYAIAADLGLDKLVVYDLDTATAKLTPHDPPFTAITPGGGPRHLAFHPNGKFAYVCTEMGLMATALAYDGTKGTLTQINTVTTLPEAAPRKGASTAECQVHPSGKFAYVSNRGHNSIAIFAIDQTTGALTPAGHAPSGGKTPRNFRIDPSGNFLLAANQDSGNVVVYKIDQQTGALTATGASAEIDRPVCIKFWQPGK